MDQFLYILLTVILPSDSLVPQDRDNPPSSSTTPAHPYLSSEWAGGCPAACSCHYGPRITVESFYIACGLSTNNSDNHSIPLDASNITSLYLNNVSSSDMQLLLGRFTGLHHVEWKDSGLEELPLTHLNSNKSLRTLDVSGNKITDIFPRPLPYFPMIQSLIVRGNNISQLSFFGPKEGQRTNITHIDLSYNLLEYIHTESFQTAPSLTFLNISHNIIDSIQGSALLLDELARLEVLDMSHNSLLTLTGLAVSKRSPLRSLNASYNMLMSLFPGTFARMPHLEELDLRHNRLVFIPAGLFAPSMRKLRRLYLSYNRLVAFGGGALNSLSGLHTLRLDHNQLAQVEASYFTRSMPDTSPGWATDTDGNVADPTTGNQTKVWVHLHSLDLSHNNISDIAPSIFHTTLALVHHVDLSFNRITCLPRYGVETLTDLESINVSHNHLQWLDIGTFKNARLRTINLSHNHLVKVISMAFLYLPSIERVDLSYNQLDYIYKYAFYKTCAYNQRLSIYLQHNELVTDALWKVISSFRHLQGGSCIVSLFMQNNSITYILGGATDSYQRHLLLGDFHYFSIWDHINVDVRDNEVLCDCEMYQEIMLLESVRKTFQNNFTHPEHLSFWKDLVCREPARLAQRKVAEVLGFMQCPLTKGCPEKCSCVFQPPKNVIQVNCQGRNLTQFPNVLPAGRKELFLSHNRLGVLRGDVNLTDIVYIDLTFNNMRFIDRQAWELLLTVPVVLLSDNTLETLPWSDQNMSITLNITLSNNTFQCTCDNILFKDWLMEHFDKIYDAFNISCANGPLQGLPMLEVDDVDFECFPEEGARVPGIPVSIFTTVLGSSLLFGIVIGSLIYKYRLYLKLFCVQRWPWQRFVNDPEKTDVFVCYSFADSKWVNRQLVPRLLSHFPPFTVLLQHRDTKPGALLSESLIDSIESSEITMLVLSRDFFQSEWMSEDCRYIINQTLQDDAHNVYVILLDDAVFDDLDPEVLECLRSQHCFSIREDWFWERLFHMLPPPQSANKKHEEELRKAEMQICAKY